uniref:Uncharacterized protein n=1 Tax=Polysiphonia infestans TaxID=2006978 RepID=A0A1Z1MEH8_9FLOR|nr:hypothetical protein [Polysiphonia infestans]ARW64309.1 hypothetical protein [Polysiphonia infestans]
MLDNQIQIICIFQKNKIPMSNKILNKITFLNEGSHTKLICYKSGYVTRLKTLQKSQQKIRYVWLKNSLYTNMTFARSIWYIINEKNFIRNIRNNYPIGLSFTQNQIDIHRKIYEMYYCYCKKITLHKGIWGRKYIIYNFRNYSTVIQEFFLTEIIV